MLLVAVRGGGGTRYGAEPRTLLMLLLALGLALAAGAGTSHSQESKMACDPDASPTYTAAVLEWSPALDLTMDNARERFLENVQHYVSYVQEAKRQGAQIVVFPECGLATYSMPHLEDTSPAVALQLPPIGANPCAEQEDSYSQELRLLSCAARDAEVYVAVNLPEEELCSGVEGCTSSGKRFYNSDIAFDRWGAVVARYRKYHLFGEDGFVPAAEPSLEYFDADFGPRFGLFTCFDLMFERPAVALVTEAGVTDIIFPTAWFSELPFLTAVQAQSSWSWVLDVNFLGSGYNLPEVGSTGSGIYAGRLGKVVATMEQQRTNKLLVGTLPNRRACNAADTLQDLWGRVVILPPPPKEVGAVEKLVKRKKLGGEGGIALQSLPKDIKENSLYLKAQNLSNFQTELLPQESSTEELKVCDGSFCCDFRIVFGAAEDPIRSKRSTEKEDDSDDNDDTRKLSEILEELQGEGEEEEDEKEQRYFYRAVAFDGVRTFDGVDDGGLQVCAVLPCVSADVESCAKLLPEGSRVARQRFASVRVAGLFAREHSLPLPSTLQADLMPLPPGAFSFQATPQGSAQQVVMETQQEVSFLTFGIHSRNFAKDD